MKPAKYCDTTRLSNLLKAAIPEQDRESFLLSYTNNRTADIAALHRYEVSDLLESLLKMVKMANAAQISKLHCLYRDLNLHDIKKELLLQYTKGRTDSTAGLTFDEAKDIIQELAKDEPGERLRKTILSFAYRAGIIYGDTEADKKINIAKINLFLRERGIVKKDLGGQNLPELKQTLGQMAAIIKSNERTANNKEAKRVTDQLLTELNINR